MAILDISAVQLEMGLSSSITEEERAILNQAISKAEGAIRRHLKYDPVQASRTEYYPAFDPDYQGALNAVWEVNGGSAVMREVSRAASDELQMMHLPIRSVTSLHIDYDGRFGTKTGAFGSGTEKTEGVDFWPAYDGVDDDGNGICRDGIIRSIGRWSVTPGSIKVVYTAGYSDAELTGQKSLVDASPIWDACLEESLRRAKKVYYLWKKNSTTGHTGPFTSENLGDYSYTINSGIVDKLFGAMASDLLIESKEKLADFLNMGYQISG